MKIGMGADLFPSLEVARQADGRTAVAKFTEYLPLRLAIWGGVFGYGMLARKRWAQVLGGASLAWQGVEYFIARHHDSAGGTTS